MKRVISFLAVIVIMAAVLCSCGDDSTANVIGGRYKTQIYSDKYGSTAVVKVLETHAPSKKKSVVPVDVYASVNDLRKKSRFYVSVESIYLSAGFDPYDDYYENFTKKKLTMILRDKFILLPQLDDECFMNQGGLYAFGYYDFNLQYDAKDCVLTVYTYKNDDLLKDAQSAGYKWNKNDVYVLDENTVAFKNSDYIIKLNSETMNDDELKSFVRSLKFEKLILR